MWVLLKIIFPFMIRTSDAGQPMNQSFDIISQTGLQIT